MRKNDITLAKRNAQAFDPHIKRLTVINSEFNIWLLGPPSVFKMVWVIL